MDRTPTGTDLARMAVWDQFGRWDESLPADRHAAIEARFPDTVVADYITLGAVTP